MPKPSPEPDTLTLRDLFAIEALKGLLPIFMQDNDSGFSREQMCESCYMLADSMLAARKEMPRAEV